MRPGLLVRLERPQLALIELLRDADQELRSLVVIKALGEIGLPRSSPAHPIAFRSRHPGNGGRSLIKVGEPSRLEACVRALDDADSDVIEALCEVLLCSWGGCGPALIQALTSDRSRRHAAAILEGGLGTLGHAPNEHGI